MLGLASSLLLPGAVSAEEPTALNEDTKAAFERIAVAYAAAVNRESGLPAGSTALRANVARQVERHTRERARGLVFDRTASHFIATGESLKVARDRVGHLRMCPICRGIVAEVLQGKAIKVVSLHLGFERVSLNSPQGTQVVYEVDRQGGLHRIDPETGKAGARPVARLAYEAGEWYAADGLQWEGPVECTGGRYPDP